MNNRSLCSHRKLYGRTKCTVRELIRIPEDEKGPEKILEEIATEN